tara:strand:+ start:1271 stop:2014 length:744 start_codon:yes stop_codon:yes gene_type:complete
MSTKVIATDKVYRLKHGTPLAYTLASRNNPRFPLMWYDEEKNVNRALRYCVNQKSPFEDEQDGNYILEPIIFDDGFLVVPKQNPVLQLFLFYHPMNGNVFVEVDKAKDAAQEVDELNLEVDALIEAKSLSIDQVEMLTRVMFGKDPTLISSAELKRDMLIFAKRNPAEFLKVLNDPELKYQAKITMFFEAKLLQLRNNGKEVWYNTGTNKKKMLSVPFEADPMDVVGHFLKTDEGIDSLRMLEATLG